MAFLLLPRLFQSSARPLMEVPGGYECPRAGDGPNGKLARDPPGMARVLTSDVDPTSDTAEAGNQR